MPMLWNTGSSASMPPNVEKGSTLWVQGFLASALVRSLR